MEGSLDKLSEELAKKLPVKEIYEDGLRPSTKQAGQLFEDIVKTLQLALFPVQALAAVQDRYRTFLDTAVRRVPTERRAAPPPQILGPLIEAIRYEPEGSDIDHMFSDLLSASMDEKLRKKVHPQFVHIIKTMSASEAVVFRSIVKGECHSEVINRVTPEVNARIETAICQDVNDFDNDEILYALERLLASDLVRARQSEAQIQSEIRSTSEKESVLERITSYTIRYYVTRLGERLAAICLPRVPVNWGELSAADREKILKQPTYLIMG